MLISVSPFWVIYGYDALSFVDMIFGEIKTPKAKYRIKKSQDIFCTLKNKISTTRNQQS